jgi:hypothetical protein
MTNEQAAALVAEWKNLSAEIADLKAKSARYAAILMAVWNAERDAKDRIAATHGGPGKFNAAGAATRAPLFERLLQISEEHGGTKTAFGDCNRLMKAYVKRTEAIRSELSKKAGGINGPN